MTSRALRAARAEKWLEIASFLDIGGRFTRDGRFQTWPASCNGTIVMTGLEAAIALARGQHRRGAAAEQLFRVLDGAHVELDDVDYQVDVLGIYEGAGFRYLQLALAGPHPRLLTVRLDAEDEDAITVVSEAA